MQKLDYHWCQTAVFEAECIVRCLTWNHDGKVTLTCGWYTGYFPRMGLTKAERKAYNQSLTVYMKKTFFNRPFCTELDRYQSW